MAAGIITKSVKDGAGTSFNAYFYDDGTGNVAPIPAAPALQTVAGASSLAVRSGAGRHINSQASNNSQTDEGFLVAIDATSAPAANATISPKKFCRLPVNDGATDGTAEIDTAFQVTAGLVLLLTKSLTSFVPGTLSGGINCSYF